MQPCPNTRISVAATRDKKKTKAPVLINLERQRTLILGPDSLFEPLLAISATKALEYMQRTPGICGIVVRGCPGGVSCELFSAVYYEEHGDTHLQARSERLLREVQSWS